VARKYVSSRESDKILDSWTGQFSSLFLLLQLLSRE
jgi:hypothetical protein